MNKRVINYFLVFGFAIYLVLIFNPIVFDFTKDKIGNSKINTEKAIIQLISQQELNQNNTFKAFLIIYERGKFSQLFSGKVLKTNNQELIKNFLQTKFQNTKSDIATVENEIIIFKNNTLYLRSGIVLDSNINGLQNSQFGWIESKPGSLTKITDKFDRNYSPIVFIR